MENMFLIFFVIVVFVIFVNGLLVLKEGMFKNIFCNSSVLINYIFVESLF